MAITPGAAGQTSPHVQIGVHERKDAEAMRQRVLADGFNAIVK